jgi:hypothetical protein
MRAWKEAFGDHDLARSRIQNKAPSRRGSVCVAVVCLCVIMKWRLQNKSAAYRRERAQGKCNRDTRIQRWNGTRV